MKKKTATACHSTRTGPILWGHTSARACVHLRVTMASKSAADFLAEMVRINVALSIHTQQLHHTCSLALRSQLMACVWATRGVRACTARKRCSNRNEVAAQEAWRAHPWEALLPPYASLDPQLGLSEAGYLFCPPREMRVAAVVVVVVVHGICAL
jgi:hypothetical protein